jgi:hypothetical protein
MANEPPKFRGIGFAPALDVNTLRAKLREMDDFALIDHGKKMKAHNFPIELREARLEWRRRHPRIVDVGSLC